MHAVVVLFALPEGCAFRQERFGGQLGALRKGCSALLVGEGYDVLGEDEAGVFRAAAVATTVEGGRVERREAAALLRLLLLRGQGAEVVGEGLLCGASEVDIGHEFLLGGVVQRPSVRCRGGRDHEVSVVEEFPGGVLEMAKIPRGLLQPKSLELGGKVIVSPYKSSPELRPYLLGSEAQRHSARASCE